MNQQYLFAANLSVIIIILGVVVLSVHDARMRFCQKDCLLKDNR